MVAPLPPLRVHRADRCSMPLVASAPHRIISGTMAAGERCWLLTADPQPRRDASEVGESGDRRGGRPFISIIAAGRCSRHSSSHDAQNHRDINYNVNVPLFSFHSTGGARERLRA